MTSAPIIPVLRDVAVKPYAQRAPHFFGGIERSKSIDEGRILRGREYRDVAEVISRNTTGLLRATPTPIPTLGGEWLFGGPMWGHFGHFFTDCVHRLWPLIDTPNRYRGVVFLGVKGLVGVKTDSDLIASTPPPYLSELMSLLSLSNVQIQYITQPTVIETLSVPPAGAALHRPVEGFYAPYLRRFQDRIAAQAAPYVKTAPDQIYLGRNHLLSKGGVLGSSYWQTLLKTNGFDITPPETLSLAEQFGRIIGAKTIVMDEGSAAHPAQMLAKIEAEFLMFPRRTRRTPFAAMIGEKAHFKTLVEAADIETLPDRFGGTTSPAGLAVYLKPEAVFASLAEHLDMKGTFTHEAYQNAEDADLNAARCNTPMIKDARRRMLDTIHARRARERPTSTIC